MQSLPEFSTILNTVASKRVQFNKLADNASRIKYLFPYIQQSAKSANKKSIRLAAKFEAQGDALLQYEEHEEALEMFNKALCICPQNSMEGKEFYMELIDKRDSVAFLTEDHKYYLDMMKFSHFKKHPWTSTNKKYPALSRKVTVEKSAEMGRHLVATDDLQIGDIIGVEDPYAAILWHDSFCRHCALFTKRMLACPDCTERYCSLDCMKDARFYHQYECDSALPLVDDGVPLRMITQRSLNQVIKEETESESDKTIEVYRSDDYYNVSRLMSIDDENDSQLILKSTIKVIYWLKLLKANNYFGAKAKNCHDLSKKEVLVGELLMKYIGVCRCNEFVIIKTTSSNYVTGGGGLYSTLSLANHSCDPPARFFTVGKKLVMRCIKPIKAGEVVHTSYTRPYSTWNKMTRRFLLQNYKFDCKCLACVGDWPRSDKMDSKILRVICKCGWTISWNYECEMVKCSKCKQENDMRSQKNIVKQMMAKWRAYLRKRCTDADILIPLYTEMLVKLYDISVPPSHLIAVLEQKLDDLYCY